MTNIFTPADILLPSPSKYDLTKWATIACDQYTSSPEYWAAVEREAGSAPSALRLTLPEIYLEDEAEERIGLIDATMDEYLSKNLFITYPNSFFYIERTLKNGKVRRGVIGKIDLEAYDYTNNAQTPVRATEQTVVERIPARVKIRSGAALELPHLMLLIDDPERGIIEPLAEIATDGNKVYDFALMQGAGKIRAFAAPEPYKARLQSAFDALTDPERMRRLYGDAAADRAPLAFAVGDGNHSLAAAKEFYNSIKKQLGGRALTHPSRYALAEVVNLYDDSLEFEPIYRVLSDVDVEKLQSEIEDRFYDKLRAAAAPAYGSSYIELVGKNIHIFYNYVNPTGPLPVAMLQPFLDGFVADFHCGIDYVHGEAEARRLGGQDRYAAFLFKGMNKSELFPGVIRGGVLPRKTFSMGEADDKRFYLECRKIGE